MHLIPWEACDQVRAHWVFVALRHIGSGHAEARLAQAAAAVLAGLALNSYVTADAIRCSWLSEATAVELTGPDDPAAATARDSAIRLAEACATPFRGDEEWLACAALVRRAAAQARVAARRIRQLVR